MYLIGGDCGKIFSLQEFVFATKSLYQFYSTSLRFISLLFAAMHDFYSFCRRCAGILFSYLPTN